METGKMKRKPSANKAASEHHLKLVVRKAKCGGEMDEVATTHDGPPRLAFHVREVAQMLGVSEKTVRRLKARGLLKPSKALRHHLIPRQQVEEFLAATS